MLEWGVHILSIYSSLVVLLVMLRAIREAYKNFNNFIAKLEFILLVPVLVFTINLI